MGNRVCIANALLVCPGVPRARSENRILIYFGAPWRIFGATVGPAGSKGEVKAPFPGGPGTPKIDEKSIKTRVVKKHEILYQNVMIFDQFL